MNSDLEIAENSQVTLHFAIRLEDGAEVDSNFGGKPATFTVGDGNLLPGFEQSLFGLKSGDKRKLVIKPEQGFGMPNPANQQKFKPEQFNQDQELYPGLVMSFNDAANTELPGVIATVSEDEIIVDFNHPLAGKTLEFEVEILSVETAGLSS